jgi:hypothetical protein
MAKMADLINEAADKYGLDRSIFNAVIQSESNGQNLPPRRVLIAGQYHTVTGAGQILDDTAAELGIDPRDPAQNIDGAARYLKKLIDQSGGDVVRAVQRYKGIKNPDAPKNVAMIERFKSFLDEAGRNFLKAQKEAVQDAEAKGFGRSETGKLLGPGSGAGPDSGGSFARFKSPEFLTLLFVAVLLATFSIFNLTRTVPELINHG